MVLKWIAGNAGGFAVWGIPAKADYFSARSFCFTSLIKHLVIVRPFEVLVLTGTGVRSKSNSLPLAPLRPSRLMWTLLRHVLLLVGDVEVGDWQLISG